MSAFRNFHTLIAIRGRRFRCVRCRIETDLEGAVRHAITNQLDMTNWSEAPIGRP